MEEEKQKDKPQSQKNFENIKDRKSTFQVKENHLDLKKDFESIKRNYKSRCYSTKIVRDFVPQIRPKKSFCKPTFFKLDDNETKSIDNDNEKDFELDKISSCDDEEDDDESKNNSSSISSSEVGMDEEEEKENELKLENKLSGENILSSLKEEEDNNDEDNNEDEYMNLAFKRKKKHKKNEEEKTNMNNLRREMSKIKSKTIVVKSKEMEEIIHHLNDNFELGVNNGKNGYYDENNNKKENDINKLSIKLGHKDNNFSILDILTIKNGKN